MFSDLAKIIEYVNDKLTEEISTQGSILTIPPDSINACSRIVEYLNLNDMEEVAGFKKTIQFSSEDIKELGTITEALAVTDPQGTIKQLSARKKYLTAICDFIKKNSVKLDDCFIDKYIKQRKKRIESKAAYDDLIKKSIDLSIFKGLGSVEWVNLWESSRKYIDYISKKDEGNKKKAKNYCVLCQQELSKEALYRIQSLQEFYDSKLKAEFDRADKEYNYLVQDVTELLEGLNKSEVKLGLESNAIPVEISDKILGYIDTLYSRAKWIYEYNDDKYNPPENVDVKSAVDYFKELFERY